MRNVSFGCKSFSYYIFFIWGCPGNIRASPEVMRKLAVFCGDSIRPSLPFSVSPTRFLALEHFRSVVRSLTNAFSINVEHF